MTDIYEKGIDPYHFKTNPSDAVRRNKIIKALGKTKYKRALDIGCGEGFITQKLPAEEIFGYDISPTALSRLPKNVIPLKRREIEGTFDLIVVAAVLQPEHDAEDAITIINKHASGTILLCHRSEVEDLDAVAKIKAPQLSELMFPYTNKDGEWINVLRIFDKDVVKKMSAGPADIKLKEK